MRIRTLVAWNIWNKLNTIITVARNRVLNIARTDLLFRILSNFQPRYCACLPSVLVAIWKALLYYWIQSGTVTLPHYKWKAGQSTAWHVVHPDLWHVVRPDQKATRCEFIFPDLNNNKMETNRGMNTRKTMGTGAKSSVSCYQLLLIVRALLI